MLAQMVKARVVRMGASRGLVWRAWSPSMGQMAPAIGRWSGSRFTRTEELSDGQYYDERTAQKAERLLLGVSSFSVQ